MPDICESPRTHGPNKGKSATGSWSGYTRHLRAGETPCDACKVYLAARQAKKNKKPNSAVSRPEPKMTGQSVLQLRTAPRWSGSRLVTCSNCGARGQANSGLLAKRQYTIPACVECRGEPGFKFVAYELTQDGIE